MSRCMLEVNNRNTRNSKCFLYAWWNVGEKSRTGRGRLALNNWNLVRFKIAGYTPVGASWEATPRTAHTHSKVDSATICNSNAICPVPPG